MLCGMKRWDKVWCICHGFIQQQRAAVSSGRLWCDVNGSLSCISLWIGMLVHDLHVLLANSRDEETAKSCGPCVALWLNVLGSIGIASTPESVELQTGQTKIHIPATWIFALLPWEYAQGLYSRSAQSAGAERHQTSSHRRLDQSA
ncbi:unnamed protein product [Penicillium nalgiovense]|uniref:Uncharacterized protein n=1 Tax=Penicillium nalgiovense TaxID=60175 RepID=A0A9W4HS68_PENNA|nr:unnamed protein product [Penicillium nalgiovense]CAG8092578.1 unnamed protein product [Penicillium nalgiovense]CAG8095446.1 unnamed protein product [Penicillium nalgiovense]CAG8098714.1 unnamed protein product [Penicillium nalgiovense]CAG8101470.1 unnamed protein product [Penicillium nalgiovense]